jgi:hypothetical protein
MIVQEGLKEIEPTTANALSDHFGLPRGTVNAVSAEMSKLQLIHLCSWASGSGGARLRVYTIGKGVDAPQPIKASKIKQDFVPAGIPEAVLNPRCDVAAMWMKNPI